MSIATARAHSNIALIKYWGKRDTSLNLPAAGSISVTLDALYTDTCVRFDSHLTTDTCCLEGARVDASRVTALLDMIRARAGITDRAAVDTHNNFPTAAGLASSASGFAALVRAACAAANLELTDSELSVLARRGSGSAARSIFGGYVEMQHGQAADGHDAHAVPLLGANDWPLAIVVAVTDTGRKAVDSRRGMTASAASSPFYPAWLDSTEDDLTRMRDIIERRDFPALGELAEHNCLKLHALMLSTRPALIYWQAATLAVMHTIRKLRADGIPVYFTIDAGPQVKALCPPEYRQTVADALHNVPGVRSVLSGGLGPAAHMLAP